MARVTSSSCEIARASAAASGATSSFFQRLITERAPLDRELLGVDLLGGHDLLEQALAVVGVVDREARGHARGRRRRPAGSCRPVAWKVPIQNGARPAPTCRVDALAHLAGGLVGEGEGEHGARVHAALAEQPGDARGQDAGLAAAGAGHDEDRAVRRGDRARCASFKFARMSFTAGSAPARGQATRSGCAGNAEQCHRSASPQPWAAGGRHQYSKRYFRSRL